MNYKLNVNKSKHDDRDYKFELLSSSKMITSNSICDYRNNILPVRNQGSQGTCYAQVASCVKEWQEERYKMSQKAYFSPQFFYNHRNYFNNGKQDGEDLNEDYGMTGRDVMRILKNVGICDESLYPYGTIQKESEIDSNIKSLAKVNVIKSYARVETLQGLKNSLLLNGPCLIAFPVYNYFDQMWLNIFDNELLGGHAMTVVGFDDYKQHFIIRNSWGKSWGDQGYCYYNYKDWNSHWECWTTVDLEYEKPKEPEPEPEPAPEPEPEPVPEPDPEPEPEPAPEPEPEETEEPEPEIEPEEHEEPKDKESSSCWEYIFGKKS